MKFFVCYTESHREMVSTFLIPSVCQHFEVHALAMPQECATAEYDSEGWGLTMARRERLMLETLKTLHEPFVWSDADVICNDFTPEDAIKELSEADLAAIDEGEGRFCAGFMIVRPVTIVSDLFKAALETEKNVEQFVLNRLAPQLGLNVRLLPRESYTSVYHLMGGVEDLSKAKVFHANWIIGIEGKMSALKNAAASFQHENDQRSSK